jgi:hypothetical protein
MAPRFALFPLVLLLTGCPAATPGADQPCTVSGAASCEPDAGRIVVCMVGDAGALRWSIYSDCKGAAGCAMLEDSAIACDTSLNNTGDRCAPASEGKARCEPTDGGAILVCSEGVLAELKRCLDGTRCTRTDAGLGCCTEVDGGLDCR